MLITDVVVSGLRRDNEVNITELSQSRQLFFAFNFLHADLLNALFI